MPYDRDTLVENARKMLELADDAIPLLDAAVPARGEKFRDGTRKAKTALQSLSLGAVVVAHQMTQEHMLPLGELETFKAEFDWAYKILAALNEFPAGALPELAAHAEEQGRMCLRCVGSRFRLLRDGLAQIVERTTGRRAAEPELAASDRPGRGRRLSFPPLVRPSLLIVHHEVEGRPSQGLGDLQQRPAAESLQAVFEP